MTYAGTLAALYVCVLFVRRTVVREICQCVISFSCSEQIQMQTLPP